MTMNPVLTVDLDAVIHNYRLLIQACPNSCVSAVVKDDAYGCGAVHVAKALYEQSDCRTFFVAYADEGKAVRSVAPQADIYVLQGFDPDKKEVFADSHLIPVLADPVQLKHWQACRPHTEAPAIQVETGLNRLGFSRDQIYTMDERVRDSFGLVVSHLACADEADSLFNVQQLNRLIDLKPLFKNARFSLAASDGCALGADYHFDLVRGGAFLYGINTFPALKKQQKNVMSLSARLILTKKLTDRDYVGYGADFHATNGTKIAVASIGYGDGLLRCFSPNGNVWFKQDKGWLSAPIAGRVSMDNLIIDVSHIPDSVLENEQDVYILCDAQTVDDIGQVCGTIGYEIMSLFGHGSRYKRFYRLNGAVFED